MNKELKNEYSQLGDFFPENTFDQNIQKMNPTSANTTLKKPVTYSYSLNGRLKSFDKKLTKIYSNKQTHDNPISKLVKITPFRPKHSSLMDNTKTSTYIKGPFENQNKIEFVSTLNCNNAEIILIMDLVPIHDQNLGNTDLKENPNKTYKEEHCKGGQTNVASFGNQKRRNYGRGERVKDEKKKRSKSRNRWTSDFDTGTWNLINKYKFQKK